MPDEYKHNTDRCEKWTAFLTDVKTDGPNILACVQLRNPGWKTATFVARQISGLFTFNSSYVHSTAVEISRNKETPIILNRQTVPQAINLMVCIGDTLGLRVSVSKQIDEFQDS